MTRWRLFPLLILLCALALALLVLLPVAGLLCSTAPFELFELLQTDSVRQALWLTFLSSGLSLPVIFLLGLPTAYGVSRYAGRWRRLLETLLELPMVMPPIVAGLALLLVFGRNGFAGQLLAQAGIRLPFSLAAVVVAISFAVTPFFVRRCMSLFDSIDPQLEEAALLLGAGPLKVFWQVSLPLLRRPLVAEGVMALAQGIGLFGAIIIFAGNLPGRTQTLSLAIYSAFESEPRQAFALGSLLLLISLALLGLVRLLSRQEGPA